MSAGDDSRWRKAANESERLLDFFERTEPLVRRMFEKVLAFRSRCEEDVVAEYARELEETPAWEWNRELEGE